MMEMIVAKSQAMQKLMEKIDNVVSSRLAIMLCGETGTGKDLLASYIHQSSDRKDHAFVTLDCATMNPNLVESELFGHEIGAFTGATSRKIGVFEMADGGTLFLNEIQNLSFDIQAKLLDVLESGTFRRVGGSKDFQSDFRLITATNEDILQLIKDGRFRLDLYFRINEVSFNVPALRERREDIISIAESFIQDFIKAEGKTVRLSKEAKQLLMAYHWPGNVRELRNVIHQAVVLGHQSELVPEDFPMEHRFSVQPVRSKQEQWSLQQIERRHIAAILNETKGNLTTTHKILDIGYSTLLRKIRKYDLERDYSNQAARAHVYG